MTGVQDCSMGSLCPSRIFVLAAYRFGEEKLLQLSEMDSYSSNEQCSVQNTTIAWVHPLSGFSWLSLSPRC